MRKKSNRKLEDPRYELEYNEWRNKVLRRDKFKCKWPKCRCKRNLQIHHIIPWSSNIHLRFDVNNGITLCIKHHKELYGKEVYFIDFLMKLI